MADLSEVISLELSDDDTVATLVVQPGGTRSDCDHAMIIGLLHEEGITLDTRSSAAIDLLLESIDASPSEAHSVVVARGSLPVHGTDGRLEWEECFDPEREDDQISSDDAISDDTYYGRSAFIMAEKGDRIGTLYKPTPGEDGVTVRGKTLGSRTGKPTPIRFDDSLHVQRDGTVVAATAGAVMFDGERLRVVSHLEIDKFVDFSTGNIFFEGDITVYHGVRDCFVVEATKDVHIHGMVEAAEIAAGRDATLRGGIAGREKGSVRVERDLKARYIDGTTVVVGRHLTVEKEIVNAHLIVEGGLRLDRGSLIGGTCSIGSACKIAELGSPCGAETRLNLGTMGGFEAQVGRLGNLDESVNQLYLKTKTDYDQLVANTQSLTPTQAEQMTELQFALTSLEKLKARMEEAGERVSRVMAENTEVSLQVQRVIQTGVRLFLGRYEATFRDPIKGPLRITLSAAGRPQITDLITESTSELSEFARVVEIDDGASQAA